MKIYKSVSGEAREEIMENKSRFVAHAFPVCTEEEAKERLGALKEKYRDAAHNVFAWQIGVDKVSQKCSDDGEPSGTGGKPVLEVIKQNGLTNILIVVTRYFGGIKLGTGGLIRAYSEAARRAVARAGISKRALHQVYKITCNYSLLGQVQNEVEKWGGISEVDYQEHVMFTVPVPEDRADSFCEHIKNVTGNYVEIRRDGEKYCEY